MIEKLLIELKIPYIREYVFNDSGNRVDFLIDNKIILEVKAERMITKEDYHQIQRYLQSLDKKLGLLVNFYTHYLSPKRIVRIETDVRKKFL
ncbi:MAG: GxxExxY protein [Cytophagales bacterium]|nr:GxxExxY protein [Cytophagales bacterium]